MRNFQCLLSVIEASIYLLLYNLHDFTFKSAKQFIENSTPTEAAN